MTKCLVQMLYVIQAFSLPNKASAWLLPCFSPKKPLIIGNARRANSAKGWRLLYWAAQLSQNCTIKSSGIPSFAKYFNVRFCAARDRKLSCFKSSVICTRAKVTISLHPLLGHLKKLTVACVTVCFWNPPCFWLTFLY